MCFSANASFGAGIAISIIGIITISKVNKPSQLLFASVPLIFAVQQFCEGFLWLTLPYPEHLLTQTVMTYCFLFFAKVFWPIWLPMSIIFLENDEKPRKIQFVWLASGLIVGIYTLIGLSTHSLQASIVGHHIVYDTNYQNGFKKYSVWLYAASTVAPSFFTHLKRTWIFGTTILISYIITAIFYGHYVISVWCFFSAIISISVYYILISSAPLSFKNLNSQSFKDKYQIYS